MSLSKTVTTVALMALPSSVWGVVPQESEFLGCSRWFERLLRPVEAPCLRILYEDVPEGISRGQSWRGGPFRIGERTYTHGLAFNATKHLLVELGGPGARFVCEAGLENNDDTQRGASMGYGSVTFHVLVGGKEAFTSPVLRLADGPIPIDVPLGGATRFEIRVEDGGDGRGWDQAVWAEAMVLLQDGSKLRLQDLPISETVAYNPFGFSFIYDGNPSASFLSRWDRQVVEKERTSDYEKREVIYRDPVTNLAVRIETLLFHDFPAAEWVVYFQNKGTAPTPILEDIQACDTALVIPGAYPPTLHWAKGAVASCDDFAPQQTALKPGGEFRLQPRGGRSSSQVLPFFNLEGTGGGVILAVGWSGEWASAFWASQRVGTAVKAGLAHTHLRLQPGEQIRTPRMLLLFYEGDRWRGQNLLRQFLLKHHRPRQRNEPFPAPITCGNWGATAAEVHLDNIEKIIRHDLPIAYYWIDAEWFGNPGPPGAWAVNVGNWEVKKDLYPEGFKPLSDRLRQSGRELLLWFEPERVFKDTPWYKDHREWLLDLGGDNCLLNLANPDVVRFLTEFVSSRIDEFGLGCYRQDFNIDPLPFWQAADPPDRQGITEIRYIEGLYAFWDALLERHPGLIIDNCASGGRRIDLETIGRSIPFWRTDGPRDPIAHQCHTYGLLPWVPLSATSQDRAEDDYEFRSSMCSALCLNWWVSGDKPAERIPEDFPFSWAKRTLEEYLQYRKCFYGDFYPLTSYSQARDVWMAYQLDRPDLGEGLVVVLKRPDSPYHTARFRLRALEEAATYEVLQIGSTASAARNSGARLTHEGWEVTLAGNPDSALLLYRRR